MAGDWETVRLGNVARTRNGAGIKQDAFSKTGIPLARVSDFTDWSIDMSACIRVDFEAAKRWESHRLKEGEAIVATVGSWPPNWSSVVGKAVRVPRSAVGAIQNQNTCCVLERPTISDQRFLFYLLRSKGFAHYAANSAAGSANQARLPVAKLERFEFPLPPLAEQKAIAAVLGALDDKIELNRRMNATLEAMARALFQSWFVDFDPVRAKLDGRQPVGMDEATAALFPEHLEDSPLGHIPKGWKAGTVVEGFNLTMGQSPPGDTYNEEGNGLPFYQGRTDFGFRFPKRRIYCTAPTRYAKPDDTLVSVRAPVGDINMANEECCIGRGVAAVRHKSGASSFTYHSMANLYPDFARFEAEGTVFGSINKDSFEKLRFVIPPDEIVAAYERQAGPLDEQIRILENQSRTLAILRDTLLPKLLSGELSTVGETK
jgi:type I restriction enzyme S subunit